MNNNRTKKPKILKSTPNELKEFVEANTETLHNNIEEKSEKLREYILEKVNSAIAKLYLNDIVLIKQKMYEVTICGRLALYLHEQFKNFKGYYVDIEYYRLKHPKGEANLREDRIRCDILLHSRGEFERKIDNLLAIEVKLDYSKDDGHSDRARLAEFVIPETPETPETAVHSTLIGMFIRLGVNGYSIGLFTSQGYTEVKKRRQKNSSEGS